MPAAGGSGPFRIPKRTDFNVWSSRRGVLAALRVVDVHAVAVDARDWRPVEPPERCVRGESGPELRLFPILEEQVGNVTKSTQLGDHQREVAGGDDVVADSN